MGRFGRSARKPKGKSEIATASRFFRPIDVENDISVLVEPASVDGSETYDGDYDNDNETNDIDDGSTSVLYVPGKMKNVPSTLIWKQPVPYQQQQKEQEQKTRTNNYDSNNSSNSRSVHQYEYPSSESCSSSSISLKKETAATDTNNTNLNNSMDSTFIIYDEDDTVITHCTPNSTEDEEYKILKRNIDAVEQKNRRRKRKTILICCIIFAIVMGITCGILFHKRNNNKEQENVTSEKNQVAEDQDEDSSLNTTESTSTSSIMGTPSPTPFAVLDVMDDTDRDTSDTDTDTNDTPSIRNQAAAKILSILQPYTERSLLLDASTPQGKAFIELLEEVVSLDTVNNFAVAQRYALMVTYFSTTGERWLLRNGWNTFEDDHCSWFGITSCEQMDDGNMAITGLDLSHNNLAGSIPTELCILSSTVQQLHMGDNILLQGHIPSCISQFTNLIEFTVDDCRLDGPLPSGLLTIPTLEIVHLYDNQFTGTLDPLFDNALVESDSEISRDNVFRIKRSFNLKEVKLYSNQLTGTIPDGFSSFQYLESLWLFDNELEGDVTADVCILRDIYLTELIMDCVDCNSHAACICCTKCYCIN